MTVLKELHNEMGHQCIDRTVSLIRERFFVLKLFSQLSKYCSVAGSRTTPCHPQGSGQVERFNRTLLQMLKTLTEKDKMNWKDSLNKLIFAYNCTKTEVTGFSSFYLLHGRSPRLPIHMLFNLPTETGEGSQLEYVQRWKKGCKRKRTQICPKKQKDIRCKCQELSVVPR